MTKIKAQQLILRIFGNNPKPFREYKAPHAYRPTPPRPRNSGQIRLRLFRGHRP